MKAEEIIDRLTTLARLPDPERVDVFDFITLIGEEEARLAIEACNEDQERAKAVLRAIEGRGFYIDLEKAKRKGLRRAGPGAASWDVNRLDCFAKGGDNSLWYKWVDRSVVHGHAGTWSGWHKLGGIFDDEPGAVSWGPHRIDVCVRGANNHMYHRWWQL